MRTVPGGSDASAVSLDDHSSPRGREELLHTYYGAFVLDPDGHNVEVVNHNR